jgi:TPR repeat protein
MGISEMANCFLNGTGVKKSAEAATSYLKFAADMGDIGAQERMLSIGLYIIESQPAGQGWIAAERADPQNLAFCSRKALKG